MGWRETNRSADYWPWRVVAGLAVPATAVAMGVMFWARLTYQIRTLPERVMDWLLQFIPLTLFEGGIQTLGTAAKEIALVGTEVALALILVALGAAALRRGPAVIASLAFALWLFAMVVVLPLGGAGFFATGLPDNVLLTDVVDLTIALAYGTILEVTYLLRLAATATPAVLPVEGGSTTRRALLAGGAGTVAAFAATLWLGQTAGETESSLPLANVQALQTPNAIPPTVNPPVISSPPVATAVPATPGGAVTPNASSVGGASVGATATPRPTETSAPLNASATPADTPSPVAPVATAPPGPALPTAVPTVVIPPMPSPQQTITRKSDGSLTASTRAPGQLAPPYTPNAGFYITTKNAGGDPVIFPDKWRLLITGAVAHPVQLDLRTLYQLPPVLMDKTLECISNWVAGCGEVPFGCDLIGNAKWKGVRLSDLLALAGGLQGGVQSIEIMGADEFSSSLPPDPALLHDSILAYSMNGAVLPLEHGYPARLLVPGRYGMKSPKWVIGIQPRRDVYVDWYGRLGWNHEAFVQTMTRIDVPGDGQTRAAGPQTIAGIAYAGNRGISRVEFSSDGGQTWQRAALLPELPGTDVWVRWQATFAMPSKGMLTLMARAVDGTGTLQTQTRTPTQPDGATGLDTISVMAG